MDIVDRMNEYQDLKLKYITIIFEYLFTAILIGQQSLIIYI